MKKTRWCSAVQICSCAGCWWSTNLQVSSTWGLLKNLMITYSTTNICIVNWRTQPVLLSGLSHTHKDIVAIVAEGCRLYIRTVFAHIDSKGFLQLTCSIYTFCIWQVAWHRLDNVLSAPPCDNLASWKDHSIFVLLLFLCVHFGLLCAGKKGELHFVSSDVYYTFQ